MINVIKNQGLDWFRAVPFHLWISIKYSIKFLFKAALNDFDCSILVDKGVGLLEASTKSTTGKKLNNKLGQIKN